MLQSQIANLEKDKTQMAQYADSLIYGFDIENYQLESLEAMLKLQAKFHKLNSYVDELKNQISIKKQNVAELEKEIKRLRNELNHDRNVIRFEIQRLVTDEWANMKDEILQSHKVSDIVKHLNKRIKFTKLPHLIKTDSDKTIKSLKDATKNLILSFDGLDFELTLELKDVSFHLDSIEHEYEDSQETICKIIGYYKDESGKIAIKPFAKSTKKVPTRLPWFIESLKAAFKDDKSSNIENLNEWNTSNVTDMSMMFEASKINQPIRFDTRNVITMYSMFYEAKHFNSPLNFDTRNVQNMKAMFYDALEFDQELKFNTKNVTDMSLMFSGASKFNKPLNFDTKNVKKMNSMF